MIAVIVLDGNVIKNKIIHVDEPINNENLLKLNMLLNTTLNGMSIEEINLGLIARLKERSRNPQRGCGECIGCSRRCYSGR